jgi:hypothetical protein
MATVAMESVLGRVTAAASGDGAVQLLNIAMARPMLLHPLDFILRLHHLWMRANVVLELPVKGCVLILIIAARNGAIVDRVRDIAMLLMMERIPMEPVEVVELEMEFVDLDIAAHSMVIVEKDLSTALDMLTKAKLLPMKN